METDQFENEELQTEDPVVEDVVAEEMVSGNEIVQKDDTEESVSGEESESDPEESEEESEDSATDDQQEEQVVLSGEIISVNEIVTISGNTLVFPDDFDFSMFESRSEVEVGNLDTVVESIENQTSFILGVSDVAIFLLGIIAGILLVHGFRLRRV